MSRSSPRGDRTGQTARVPVTYRVLGPLEAIVDGRPARLGGPRQRAVLAVLLLRAGEVVPCSVLVDAVWGNDPPDSATNLLQGYVSGLRKVLGREVIETAGPGYRLRALPEASDLRRFERLVADGAAAMARGRPDEARDRFGEALRLWQGPALADVAADGVAAPAAARLEELRLAARERHAEALLATGAAREAAAELAQVVDQHPLREGPLAQLVLALYRCGRQADALAAYRRGREALVSELGIEPGAALRELEAAILRQDRALAGPEAAPTQGRCQRTVLVCALDPSAVPGLVVVAEPLVRGEEDRDLVVVTVATAATLTSTAGVLDRHRTELAGRGVPARTAVFTSPAPGADLARLAAELDAELLLVDAPDGLLGDARLMSLLEQAPCDVAVLVPGSPGPGPVLVAFAGAEHDWAAVELGAWSCRGTGARLRLVGALAEGDGRDASRLLASASLAVQRALGVAAEPVLVAPRSDALVAAAQDAGLVVVGLTERWRAEGVGPTRTTLATGSGRPTLLVRRGLRPGGLAPRAAGTRFTWTVVD